MLSYSRVYRKSGRHLGNLYGWGSGPIWLDGVQCIGNESSIAECEHKDWGVHNCGHHMDVSVICDTGKCWEQSSSEHWTGEGTIAHRALWVQKAVISWVSTEKWAISHRAM